MSLQLFKFTRLLVGLLATLLACDAFNSPALTSYDSSQAQRSVWLSAAAYCGKNNYASHKFSGPLEGFVVTKALSDTLSDTEGFIGYLPSDKSIYVSFRGTSDIRNWISDLDVIKIPYPTYADECGGKSCEVHQGFYDAMKRVFPTVLAEVQRLLKSEAASGYHVKTTGHSLGAALAHLTAMELMSNGVSTSVYNFGMPREGNDVFAAFASSLLPLWRVTHHKDIVPHVPLSNGMDFYHVCTERYEDENGNMHSCSASCEDPSCADQFKLAETSVSDHMTYLGLYMSCDSV